MDAETQFLNIAKLARAAIDSADHNLVPVDTIKHLLRVTEAQAEMARLGLLEEEQNDPITTP